MSENNAKRNKGDGANDAPLPPENQGQRWVKYGSNVALSIVLVIAVAVLLTWVAQRTNARADLTAGGSLSLKPQTVNVLGEAKQKITLVSLYARPQNEPEQAELAQRVADLLDEYRAKSSKIDVKVIDPLTEKDKLEELHQDFITRYGSQIKGYKDYLEDWQKQFAEIKKMTDAEAAAVAPFAATGDAAAEEEETPIAAFARTISEELPRRLESARKAVEKETKKKHPDYKAAADTARTQMEQVSQLAGSIAQQAPMAQRAKGFPDAFKKYLADSVPRYNAIKKAADDVVAKAAKLGELKVDELERALNVENPILVLGENDWRILSESQIWQQDTDVRAMVNGAKITPRFAGEQQVTTAIYALEHPKKQKIMFVRTGGQPLAQAGFPPFVQGGPLSSIADRFRQYNFEVLEKDITGQWAMQSQMRQQQMPQAPEATDEDMKDKDAIWIVLDAGADPQQQPSAATLGTKLKEHLARGGSAMVLADIRGDAMPEALRDWGVELHPDAVCVHEAVALTNANGDPIEEAKARPFIWDCRDYGDHPLAKPIKNLDSVFVAPTVVRTTQAAGCTVTPLLPLSTNVPGLKTWGETNIDDLNKSVEYNADKGDLAGPVSAGAVVEKQGAGRLVVIGSVRFMFDGMLRIPDPRLLRKDPPVLVNRFPGNAELATNSIFWLAHLEPMIAISPTAMDVSRIGDIGDGMLKFWRNGVLLIILPACVLAAGAFVYAARRD